MPNYERKLNSKVIYEGKIINVYCDDVYIEGLNINAKREIVKHNGGACALIKLKNGRIKFVKQYRYAVGKELLELPAGKIDPLEDENTTIVRECQEEVGILPNKVEYMGYMHLSPGFCNEVIYLYYIDDYKECDKHFDFDESLDEYEYTFDEAINMINEGIIVDAKTICLLYRCQDKFKK